MTAPALQLHGAMPRWSGWAIAAAVHAAMLLALASAFAPTRPASALPMTISARLVPASTTPAVAVAAAIPVSLPRSALAAPPIPDIPPPPVHIEAAAPVAVTATPLRLDPPAAAAIDPAAIAAPRAMATAMAVAAVSTTAAPAPAAMTAQPAPAPSDTPASLPPDHRLCSDRQTARLYPAMLRERGVQGMVTLRVKVDADGRAAEVVVSGGSGWRLLDEAARRVAEACPFVPARRGDQRLVSWVEYPVRFALQPSTLQ